MPLISALGVRGGWISEFGASPVHGATTTTTTKLYNNQPTVTLTLFSQIVSKNIRTQLEKHFFPSV